MTTPLKTVDEYIAGQPKAVAGRLSAIRQEVKKLAPQATEKLSYGMPYYCLNGRLIYFASHQEHIGLYPMKSTIAAFEKELKDYETSAGTICFLYNQPLPMPLIRDVIKHRVKTAATKNT